MRKKLLRNICAVMFAMLVAIYLIFCLMMYYQKVQTVQQQLAEESRYLAAAVEQIGVPFLEQLKTGSDDSSYHKRITLIENDGTVIYESDGRAAEMENHNARPEIREARERGYGTAERYSDTLQIKNFYYAVKLGNDQILRVAVSTDSVYGMLGGQFFLLAVLAGVLLCVSAAAADRLAGGIVKPINELDLQQPEMVYDELEPLLQRLDHQNQQIREQMKELREAERIRREFSANVSHELKTPLTSISGYAEIMENGLVKSEDMPVFAGRIHKEARRLIDLIEDIIQLSRLEEVGSEWEREPVELMTLCREVLHRLGDLASQRQVTLELHGEEVMFRGVRRMLDEMVMNLCDNAIKYNQKGGTVEVYIRKTENSAELTVRDNGIGIPQEHHPRIFERFYRVDKSHSRETGGTGLGLSIVKHAAMIHDIQICLDSVPGEGTTITLRFPMTEAVH